MIKSDAANQIRYTKFLSYQCIRKQTIKHFSSLTVLSCPASLFGNSRQQKERIEKSENNRKNLFHLMSETIAQKKGIIYLRFMQQ